MTKLDARLLNLKSLRAKEGENRMKAMARAPSEPVYFEATTDEPADDPLVSVIVRFNGSLAAMEQAGLVIDTVAGNIATGSIRVSRLDSLDQAVSLEKAEAAVPLKASIDISVPEIKANLVHSGPPGVRGAGVVVGIVDSGVDFTHENFRSPTGSTRIVRIWDQNLTPQAGEVNPAGFSYGVEYVDTAIDAALLAPNPFAAVRHQDSGVNHGTHVAGIAAGDGSLAGAGQPADTFVGVAPEATIVAVATDFMSTGVVDGVDYVFRAARALGRPAVVNLSLGSAFGPHDGSSNFEQAITNLVTGAGRVVVAAAGNEADDGAHASVTVIAGGTTSLTLNVPAGRNAPAILDLWYEGADVFGVALIAPGGASTGNVAVGATFNAALGGVPVFVDHRNNDPVNGDKRVTVIINPAVGGAVPAGGWQLQLAGTTVGSGRADAWMINPPGQPRVQFPPGQATAAGTIGTPATANNVISVGSYITRGAGVGDISTFSNRGPTRDGRPGPMIAAPGQRIISANRLAVGAYQTLSGTSMACPHITGVAALILQVNPGFTWSQVRDCLQRTARADTFTGTTPNNTWGAGKVDAQAAISCARPAVPTTRLGIDCLPPRSRLFLDCPPPRSRADILCPVTRFDVVCVTPTTRRPPECIVLVTRLSPLCPQSRLECPVSRLAPECPPITRACPASRLDACPTRLCPPDSRLCGGPGDPGRPPPFRRSQAHRALANEQMLRAYEEAYRLGYADAYAEAYGTCENCEPESGDPNAGSGPDDWFEPGEFE